MYRDQERKKKRFLLKGQDKYDKIAYREKILLLKRVLLDKAQIKETAHDLQINYSTAKTFLRKFKTRNRAINSQFINDVYNWFYQYQNTHDRCSYKTIGDSRGEQLSRVHFSRRKEIKIMQEENMMVKIQQMSQQSTQVNIVQQIMFKD